MFQINEQNIRNISEYSNEIKEKLIIDIHRAIDLINSGNIRKVISELEITSINNQIKIVFVEGNIGIGKSYLLNQLSNEFAVIPEPLAIWESIYLDECNLIELMYLDPEKYGVVFEVIISRINVSLFNTVLDYCDKNIILFERSIFSTRIFMDIHKYANQIRFNELDAKLKVLCEEIKKSFKPHLVLITRNNIIRIGDSSLDGYHRIVEAIDCYNHILARARSYEKYITIEYLIKLSILHNNFFNEWQLPKLQLTPYLCSDHLSDTIQDINYLVKGTENLRKN